MKRFREQLFDNLRIWSLIGGTGAGLLLPTLFFAFGAPAAAAYRWTVIVGCLALGGTAFFLFGRDAASYVKTLFNLTRRQVKDQVPLEFQLQRAKDVTDEILSDMDKLLKAYTRQQLATEDLEEEVRRSEASGAVGRLREQLVALKDRLETEAIELKKEIAARERTIAEERRHTEELEQELERAHGLEEECKRLQDAVEDRDRELETARAELNAREATLKQKDSLIAELNANHEAVVEKNIEMKEEIRVLKEEQPRLEAELEALKSEKETILNEKRRVEQVHAGQKAAFARVHLAGRVGIRVVIGLYVPTVRRDLTRRVHAVAQQTPE